VRILGTTTMPCQVIRFNERAFRFILTQGLFRQIRRLCEVFGYKVQRLQRIRIMNIYLDGIKKREWREVSTNELNHLIQNLT
ncbi:23S rRNA pseudouridine synthase F, partial [Brevibacillus laterosporus]|nr:23S rRNA pseudouridine synthase F [Brevibacillus laterosporus]